jgi:hypothetical protein
VKGQRFGSLPVLCDMGHDRWSVRCDCGTEKVVRGGDIREGRTKSCGCFRAAGFRRSRLQGSGAVSDGPIENWDELDQ